MKVIHVIWHLGQGGAQTYLYQLIKELIQTRKYDQQEVLVQSSPGSLSEQFHDIGIPVQYAQMKNGLDIMGAFRVYRLLDKSDADIIHSHSNNLLFNALLRFLSRPVVYTEHGGGLLGRRKRDYMIYQYLYSPITKFIAISDAMARLMKGVNPAISGRVVTIPNGVNLNAIENETRIAESEWQQTVKSKRYYVGIIGRLVEQKGVDLFVNVAEKIVAQRNDIGFVIVGDGVLRNQLQSAVDDKQLNDSVFFTGYRSNGIAWLKCFDIFLFTSKFEPFGLVITEAMACGVPVVAAHRCGAVPEIIEDGESGLIVMGEDIKQLADCVCKVLDNNDLRDHLVSTAKNVVSEKFSIATNAAGIAAVYDSCKGQ